MTEVAPNKPYRVRLSVYWSRRRAIWYVTHYTPVVFMACVALLAARIPAGLVVALVIAGPAVIWFLGERANAAALHGLSVTFNPIRSRASAWGQFARGHLGPCVAVLVIWALGLSGVLFLAVAYAYAMYMNYGPWIRGGRAVAPRDLPPEVQRVLALRPGLPVKVFPAASIGFSGLAAGRDGIYLADSFLTADPEDLAAVVAHELAHHIRGTGLGRVLATARNAGAGVFAWLLAVAAGRMPATAGLPGFHTAFAPALATLVFAGLLAQVLTEPFWCWASRSQERATDRLALEILGTGDGYARWFRRQVAEQGVLPEPRLYRALCSTHPSHWERISTAEAFRPSTP